MYGAYTKTNTTSTAGIYLDEPASYVIENPWADKITITSEVYNYANQVYDLASKIKIKNKDLITWDVTVASTAITSVKLKRKTEYLGDYLSNATNSSAVVYSDGLTWKITGSSYDPSTFYGTLTPEAKAKWEKQIKRGEFINRIKSYGIISKPSKSLGGVSESTPEGRARALLREMVGEQEFMRYLRRGCLEVTGKSGLKYVIYGNTIHVYAKTLTGKFKKVESICLIFHNPASLPPPTDHVIMRKLMIESDEFGMRSISNRVSFGQLDDVVPEAKNIIQMKRSA